MLFHFHKTQLKVFLDFFRRKMGEKSEPRKSGLQVPVDPITVAEIASIAKSRIKKDVWDYYGCGADSQNVLHENEAAFKT